MPVGAAVAAAAGAVVLASAVGLSTPDTNDLVYLALAIGPLLLILFWFGSRAVGLVLPPARAWVCVAARWAPSGQSTFQIARCGTSFVGLGLKVEVDLAVQAQEVVAGIHENSNKPPMHG